MKYCHFFPGETGRFGSRLADPRVLTEPTTAVLKHNSWTIATDDVIAGKNRKAVVTRHSLGPIENPLSRQAAAACTCTRGRQAGIILFYTITIIIIIVIYLPTDRDRFSPDQIVPLLHTHTISFSRTTVIISWSSSPRRDYNKGWYMHYNRNRLRGGFVGRSLSVHLARPIYPFPPTGDLDASLHGRA